MKSQAGKSNISFFLVAALAIGIGLYTQVYDSKSPDAPEFVKTILLPKTKALGTVEFTDHNQQSFGADQLQGKWSILFFGFTNCPDICPTTMQTLKQVKQKVAAEDLWHNYQVIMVSVDPERDSLERLRNYVPFFDPEFIGIAGTVEHTTEFAKNLGILFFKGDEVSPGAYDVDHSAALILINPEGRYAGVISAPHKTDEISADLISLAGYQGIPKTKAGADQAPVSADQAEPEVSANSDSDAALSFEEAWIRPAPPNTPSMAAYFKLVNQSGSDITITGVESPAFHMSMIHTTIVEDGVASMKHLDDINVPAAGSVTFAPMGNHVMLMGPKSPLNEGQSAEITLIGEDGARYSVEVPVRNLGTE